MTRTNLKIYSGKLDIVPVLDVFFLLLIFALIGSSLVFQPGIPVQLPQAGAADIRGVPKIIVTITRPRSVPRGHTEITSNGQPEAADKEAIVADAGPQPDLLFFNDRRVEWEELEQNLRQEVHDSRLFMARMANDAGQGGRSRHAPLLVLRADRGVPYEKIIRILSMGRSLGLGVYLVTEPEKIPGVLPIRRP